MTKASANPRRYSRGPEGLDPNQLLHVYLALRVDEEEVKTTIARLDYMKEKHKETELEVVAYRHERGRIVLTVQVTVGPARAALRADTPQLQASYTLLWDIVKTLFYAHPIFVGPPSEEDRANVKRALTAAAKRGHTAA